MPLEDRITEIDSDRRVIVKAIRTALGDPAIHIADETRLVDDLGMDSLMLLSVIEDVQRDCGVAFSTDDYSLENFATMNDLLGLVANSRRRAHRFN